MEKAEKKIFDPRFVHFMWNDELEGKEGFIASTIRRIIDCVENDVRANRWQKLEESHNTDLPFHSTTGMDYGFAYYDPLYEVKQAWKQGKMVQYMTTINVKNGWADVTEDWAWDVNRDTQYRIKPEKDLRPFKDIQELKNAWSDKAGMSEDYEEPLIWVRWKDGNEHRLINAYNYGGGDELRICGDWVSLKQLFEQYEFIDGSRCGVEVEE